MASIHKQARFTKPTDRAVRRIKAALAVITGDPGTTTGDKVAALYAAGIALAEAYERIAGPLEKEG